MKPTLEGLEALLVGGLWLLQPQGLQSLLVTDYKGNPKN